MGIIKKEDIKDVAAIKRVMEMCALIPGFQEKVNEDPYGTIKELGLDLVPQDVSFSSTVNEKGLKLLSRFPDSLSQKYVDYMDAKVAFRDKLFEDCAPSNPAMNKWRKRQIGRCNLELGSRNKSLIHVTFTLEMADGCSVGCEFCGLNAGKLKGLYRYTDENARLFRKVISSAKEIIGDAAGCGTMYFASEPLDNPDYEKFLDDYEDCFGRTPQITTAIVTRDIDRMKRLLSRLDESSNIIYRFSITSREMAETVLREFTPEELIYVELLPQYEEAPGNGFVKVGRAAEMLTKNKKTAENDIQEVDGKNPEEDGNSEIEDNKNEEFSDTISCISGFKVNMVRKEIVLTTPTNATKQWPTGVIILDKAVFTDGDDFAEKLKGMIRKHMMNIIKPSDRIHIRDFVKIEKGEGNLMKAIGREGAEYHFTINENSEVYLYIFDILKEGYITRRDLVSRITSMEKYRGTSSEAIFYIINRLWEMGIIETESGAI